LLLSLAAPRCAKTFRGLSYREGDRGQLDVYAPPMGQGGAPTVVFFYGGGWRRGDRARYRFMGQVLASCGMVAVIPDYRIYPDAQFPDFIEDAAAATAWAKANIAQYGGDPDKLFLMGHSAGAYNAAMLALDSRWLEAVGLDPRRDLCGAIGLAGPYDFLPLHSETMKAIFGEAAQSVHTQPIEHVDGRAPPMLLITGGRDTVVDPKNTSRLAGRIRALQGRVAELAYPHLSHLMALGVFLPILRFRASILTEVRRFIQFHSVEPRPAESRP
jgi:acetyl esterase/lipase